MGQNYLAVGRMRVAGKVIANQPTAAKETIRFEVAVPASYVLWADGRAHRRHARRHSHHRTARSRRGSRGSIPDAARARGSPSSGPTLPTAWASGPCSTNRAGSTTAEALATAERRGVAPRRRWDCCRSASQRTLPFRHPRVHARIMRLSLLASGSPSPCYSPSPRACARNRPPIRLRNGRRKSPRSRRRTGRNRHFKNRIVFVGNSSITKMEDADRGFPAPQCAQSRLRWLATHRQRPYRPTA